jgi:alpha-D-xyloside xylohydrolase
MSRLLLALCTTALFAQPVRFSFPTTAGGTDSVTLDQFLVDGHRPAAPPRTRRLALGVTEITVDAPAIGEWSFAITDLSAYYGFGERYGRLNHVHTILKNASRDVAGDKGSGTYQPIPFYMSLRGYGLWLDTTAEATFDLNVTDADRILVRCPAARLRLVLFEGPRFPQILERFTALVGRAQLPPYWAFAPWKARDYHRNSAEVREDVDRYRQLGLPASVLLIDSPWATNYNSYDFNPRQFDDVPGLISHIHDNGFKLVLWHTPWINTATKRPHEDTFADKLTPGPATNFAEAERLGHLLRRPDGSTYIGQWWKGTGALVDFTKPAAKAWWQGQLDKVIRQGVDGFKDDDAEGGFVDEVAFAGGQDSRLMRNRYAVEYNRAVAEALQRRKGSDWVLFQRSGTIGSHTLPLFWSGDNDASFSADNGLPTVVTAGLNAGLSGISLWMSDLGGYNRASRAEGDATLFARWTEYSALSPGMEVMSAMNLGPWDYGDQALAIFRDYSVLHMSLFPYRYAAAQESARSGLPILRALVLVHQDDREARETATEYYFGPDLLVAPILSPVSERAVYLPEGDWIDYWSGARLTGRHTIVAAAPLNRIPLYVRPGTVLPRIPEDVMTLVRRAEVKDPKIQALDDRRVYDLYPGDAARSITDFEGRKLDYDPKAGTLSISGPPARVTVRWRFAKPASATLDGAAIAVKDAAVEFAHHSQSRLNWTN